MRAVQARVTGLVQGVGFRYATQRQARHLGLVGWVRNCPDGSVEAFAQGPDEAVAAFVRFLDNGPPGSRVAAVDIDDKEPEPSLSRFEVRF